MFVRWLINAIALWFAAWLVAGVHLSENLLEVARVALVFGVVNTFIKPVVLLLSLPMLLLPLGLFTFVVNATMLALVASLTLGRTLDGVRSALLGSAVVSIASFVLSALKDESLLEAEVREILYDKPLDGPNCVEDVDLEGMGATSFPMGAMRLDSCLDPEQGQAAQIVFCCPEEFPTRYASPLPRAPIPCPESRLFMNPIE